MKQIDVAKLRQIEAAINAVADLQGHGSLTYNEVLFAKNPDNSWFVGLDGYDAARGATMREAWEKRFEPLGLPKLFVSREGVADYERSVGSVKVLDGRLWSAFMPSPWVTVTGNSFEDLLANLRHALRWTHDVSAHE